MGTPCKYLFTLMVVIACTRHGATADDLMAHCSTSDPCSCCSGGICIENTDFCRSCKDGYTNNKCQDQCPSECISCDIQYRISSQCIQCRAGYFGTDCSSNCSSQCKDSVCHKDNGNCVECDPGHYGNKTCSIYCPQNCNNSCDINTGVCDTCKDGYYGQYCNETCPSNCLNHICNRASGECVDCTAGFYGHTCNKSCSEHCQYDLCNKISGNCFACTGGYHGLTCTNICPATCNQTVCDQLNSHCNEGCIPNFRGDKCEMCVIGKHGDTCNADCPINCRDNECSKQNGSCVNGCKTGYSDFKLCCLNNTNCESCSSYTECKQCRINYTGDTCDECVDGKYGLDCDKTCPENCLNKTCHRESGECTNGCNTGYSDERFCCAKGNYCEKCSSNTECSNCTTGAYGELCENNCSTNCIGGCNKDDGHCHACEPMFYGDMCNLSCSPGCSSSCSRNGTCDSCKGNKYGHKCDFNCSMTCNHPDNETITCERDNGSCTFGCKPNLYGKVCEKVCSKLCDGGCAMDDGRCSSCIDNRFGIHCENKCSEGCLPDKQSTSHCNEETGKCASGCMDGYTGDTCIKSVTEKKKAFPVTTVIGIIVGVIVLVLIVIIVVVARKRCAGKETAKSDGTLTSTDMHNNAYDDQLEDDQEEVEVPVEVSTQDEQNNPYYSNARRPTTRIRKKNVRQYLHKSDDKYQEEFKFLPNGLIKPTTEARKPANVKQNRYNSVYPYDDSRVKVFGKDSDYINACYIDGYKDKKAYIASQGPTTKQMGTDFKMFWRMVWQEKVETIVMVTKLKELSGMKCDQYWPNLGISADYAEFTLHCAKEEVYAEFVVRSLTISKGDEKRHINHVNFTAWPDKGVPNDVISLINLRHKVVKMKKMYHGPLLVHCSAGIGRTGTFIGLDILTHQGRAEDHVDVFECVLNMRQQRVNMVQTLEQYKFLHHAIMWTLSTDSAPLSADRFLDLSWLDTNASNEMLTQLQLDNFYDNQEEKMAVHENMSIPLANRQGADVPGHRHTVTMDTNERSHMPSYINAVYLDSYKKQNRFIAAMSPLPETVTQFLSMLLQEDVTVIVDLDPPDYNQGDLGEYLPPENQDLEYESTTFRTAKRETLGCVVKREILVSQKNKSADRTIHHYQLSSWQEASALPGTTNDFVKLVDEVDATAIKTEATGPIVVHCPTGAERCGLFCAVWLLIERMTVDLEVSVLNTLRQVKTRRRMAIPSAKQVVFCCECVAEHKKIIDRDHAYSNFVLQVTDGSRM